MVHNTNSRDNIINYDSDNNIRVFFIVDARWYFKSLLLLLALMVWWNLFFTYLTSLLLYGIIYYYYNIITSHRTGLLCLFLAISDFLATYLTVTAYQYTSLVLFSTCLNYSKLFSTCLNYSHYCYSGGGGGGVQGHFWPWPLTKNLLAMAINDGQKWASFFYYCLISLEM